MEIQKEVRTFALSKVTKGCSDKSKQEYKPLKKKEIC